jgi:hypothetical protein
MTFSKLDGVGEQLEAVVEEGGDTAPCVFDQLLRPLADLLLGQIGTEAVE